MHCLTHHTHPLPRVPPPTCPSARASISPTPPTPPRAPPFYAPHTARIPSTHSSAPRGRGPAKPPQRTPIPPCHCTLMLHGHLPEIVSRSSDSFYLVSNHTMVALFEWSVTIKIYWTMCVHTYLSEIHHRVSSDDCNLPRTSRQMSPTSP